MYKDGIFMNLKISIGLLAAMLYVVSCSHPGTFVKHRRYKVRGVEAVYDMPVEYNERVEKWINYFQRENHARLAVYLSRSGRYLPMMRAILAEEGLPQDLVYLAMIESGFSTHAYSRAHAVGTWQFIRSTGRHYDLKINSWVDERRDPEKATRAAARYLKKLYRDFGDWYLALAAYNAGEGRVFRAIRQSRSNNYWHISAPRRHYLRRETKEYVPKFLAAMIIAKNPSRFGFRPVRYEEPMAYERVSVAGPLGLDVASDLARRPEHELRAINPELRLGMTPHGRYELKVPAGTAETFRLAYAGLPPSERVRVVYHRVRSGDSVWRIAKRYGVSRDALMAANNLTAHKARRLRPGQRLVVPKKGAVAARSTSPDLLAYNEGGAEPANKKLDGVEYMIRKDFRENGADSAAGKKIARGEKPVTPPPVLPSERAFGPKTGGGVIDLEGMEASQLPQIEETDLGGKPKVAEAAALAQNAGETKNPAPQYVVRRGDNLWRIARKHGVTVSNLRSWNNLPTNRIHPGKSLHLTRPE